MATAEIKEEVNWKDWKEHPFASFWPRLSATDSDAFQAMVEDMQDVGWRGPPLLLFGDMVLDGRNRLEAWIAAGKEDCPPYQLFDGTEEEAAAEVARRNARRRHMTKFAIAITTLLYGNRTAPTDTRPRATKISISQLAKLSGVSLTHCQYARQVYVNAPLDLLMKCCDGTVG